jgi:hypothetical protein
MRWNFRRYFGLERPDEPFGGREEPTPVMRDRTIVRCTPCLGSGRIHLVGGRLDGGARRTCPGCKGLGCQMLEPAAQPAREPGGEPRARGLDRRR